MKRVIVSVTNNLATDQRVARVCESLQSWGYNILLVGRQWPNNPLITRSYTLRRFKLVFNRKFLFYAEYNLRLFFFLLFRKADILLSNDLDTLPANFLAAKIKGCKIVFDSHEYFPETPEVYQRQVVRKFWLFIERLFIKQCSGYITVSQSVANIYFQKYSLKFEVIRNVPFRHKIVEQKTYLPFIIYQGSINIGRGLELILEALLLLNSVNLVIVGKGPELSKLKKLSEKLGLTDRVKFLGELLPGKLREITVQAAVGISVEEPIGASYKAALPNKLFDYIQARVPVLVSDLIEMKTIVNQYQIGMILEERTPEKVASILNLMLTDEGKRREWKNNLAIAAEKLCWENESVRLKKLFEELND